MRFLVDECTGPAVAAWLRRHDHEVFSVYEQARGLEDDQVIQMAVDEDRILVTNDKDIGAKVFRDRRPHRGVILLRLEDDRARAGAGGGRPTTPTFVEAASVSGCP